MIITLILTRCGTTKNIETTPSSPMTFPPVEISNALVIYKDKNLRLRVSDCQTGDFLIIEGEKFYPTTPNRSMLVVTIIFENLNTNQSFPISLNTIFAQYSNVDPDFSTFKGKSIRPPELIVLLSKKAEEKMVLTKFDADELIASKDWIARRYIWSFPKPHPPDTILLNQALTVMIRDEMMDKISTRKFCKKI